MCKSLEELALILASAKPSKRVALLLALARAQNVVSIKGKRRK
jgi:hypothetical protein